MQTFSAATILPVMKTISKEINCSWQIGGEECLSVFHQQKESNLTFGILEQRVNKEGHAFFAFVFTVQNSGAKGELCFPDVKEPKKNSGYFR